MKKIIFISLFFIFLLIIAIIMGLYAGGYAALYFSHSNTGLLTWYTFSDVINTFSGNAHYKKIVTYAWAGFAVPLVVWCVFTGIFLAALLPKKTLYGDARLANDRDLHNSGFFPKTPNNKHPAILIGKMHKGRYKNRYIHFYGQQFLILYAPTRSGKGVGIVIPNCISYPDSMVILDIKLENFFLTAGWRKKCGNEVFLFCPAGFAKTENEMKTGEILSHRWNPLDCVSRSSIQRQTDLRKIASIIYPLSGGDNDIWNTAAINLFVGLGLYLLDKERSQYQQGTAAGMTVSVAELLKTSVPETGDLAKWMLSEIKNNHQVSDETVHLFRQFCGAPDKTRGSIFSIFTNELAVFNNPVTAAATGCSDFDIRDVRKKKMTVYLGLTPNILISHAKVVNLFFSMLIGENTQELPENNPSLLYQCLILLDEFTSMGKSEIIQKSVPYAAGYNLRYLFILQNKGQLEDSRLYGKEGTETFIENTGVEIFYPPKTINDMANTISEKIGVRDEKVMEKSTSSGQGSSRTTSHRVMERAALLPEEIISLREKKNKSGNMAVREIIFSDNCRPFIANKIIYFEDKFFIDRVNYSRKNTVSIPCLFNKEKRQQLAKELVLYDISRQVMKMPDLVSG